MMETSYDEFNIFVLSPLDNSAMKHIIIAQSPEPRAQSPEPRAQSQEPRAQSSYFLTPSKKVFSSSTNVPESQYESEGNFRAPGCKNALSSNAAAPLLVLIPP
jgi:hypothetical protein